MTDMPWIASYPDGVRWRIGCVNDAGHLGDVVTEKDSG